MSLYFRTIHYTVYTIGNVCWYQCIEILSECCQTLPSKLISWYELQLNKLAIHLYLTNIVMSGMWNY